MLCNRRVVTYSKRGLQMADRSGPLSPFRGHSFFAWWQKPPWRVAWWWQIEYQHCVGWCCPTRHRAAPENGRILRGLAICNLLSKVCKLAIVIQYMLRILWFKQKLVSLSNDNVDVMNDNRKFGSSKSLERTLLTTPGARDFLCAVSGFGQGL